MILYLIISFFISILGFILSFLPTITALPFGLDSSIAAIFGAIHASTSIFPFIGTVMLYLVLVFGIQMAFFTWRIAVFVYNAVRGSGA